MPELFDWVNCDVGVENKFHMFLGGKDDGVALRFFWNGSYEKYTLKIWSELAKKIKGFALDIGAHTGCYSLAALAAAVAASSATVADTLISAEVVWPSRPLMVNLPAAAGAKRLVVFDTTPADERVFEMEFPPL